jgi:membrane protein implicated in regulation of membrane protease activity
MPHVVKGFLVTMLTAAAAGLGIGAATGSWRGGVLVWMIASLVAIPLADRIVHRPDSPPDERPWPEL